MTHREAALAKAKAAGYAANAASSGSAAPPPAQAQLAASVPAKANPSFALAGPAPKARPAPVFVARAPAQGGASRPVALDCARIHGSHPLQSCRTRHGNNAGENIVFCTSCAAWGSRKVNNKKFREVYKGKQRNSKMSGWGQQKRLNDLKHPDTDKKGVEIYWCSLEGLGAIL